MEAYRWLSVFFSFFNSSIFGSGEPVPSTSCSRHLLILVIQCLITQLLLF